MPATEETYRPQPILHLVFAISSIAMLLSIVWMVVADHFRPWKQVQREFQEVEREKLEKSPRGEAEGAEAEEPGADRGGGRRRSRRPRQSAEQRASEIRQLDRELDKQGGKVQLLDMQRRFKKAELDSKRSLYDGMIERNDEAGARAYLATVVSGAERELDDLSKELETAEKERNATEAQKDELLNHMDEPQEGAGAADARGRPGGAGDRAEGRPLRRPRPLVQRADGLLPQPARRRPDAAHQDPADQPPRADDQLQLQGSAPLRPLHDLPPGDRPDRLRQGCRRQGR